jgi:hypothetical protein
MLSESGSSMEFPYHTQFVPELFQTMVDWIHHQFKISDH